MWGAEYDMIYYITATHMIHIILLVEHRYAFCGTLWRKIFCSSRQYHFILLVYEYLWMIAFFVALDLDILFLPPPRHNSSQTYMYIYMHIYIPVLSFVCRISCLNYPLNNFTFYAVKIFRLGTCALDEAIPSPNMMHYHVMLSRIV